MDTSETYVKMRLAAISDLLMGYPPQEPMHMRVFNCHGGAVWVDAKGDWYYTTEEKAVQLERQDQLQEMVKEKSPHRLTGLISGFSNPPQRISMRKAHWEERDGDLDLVPDPEVMNQSELDYPKQFTSMEQLWLAFVMKEKYNKIWNGEDWIEEK